MKIGDYVHSSDGKISGTVISIRSSSVVLSENKSNRMVSVDFNDLLNIEQNQEEKHQMSPKNRAIIEHKVSENRSLITIDEAVDAYYKGVSEWNAKKHKQWLPEDLGQACVDYIIEGKRKNLDELAESHLFGTKEVVNAYKAMTPGQTPDPEPVAHKVDPDYKTVKKEDKKKPAAVLPGKDVPSTYSAGPLGGYGLVYNSVTEETLPKNPKVVAWALQESTKNSFFERYGEKAGEELLKAASRFNKLGTKVINVMEERKKKSK